jgi:LEA14-like dessication related protein
MAKIGFYCLLLALIIAGCTRPKDLQYVDFENVKVLKWGLQQSEVGVDIRFYNPNHQSVQLKQAAVDIFVNNEKLGHSTLDTLIHIPKRDTFSIPVVLQVETMTAASNIIRSLSDTATLIKLEGQAKLGKGGVFFNYPIRYEGIQRLRP